jgi:hypothetical protein
LVSSGLAHEVIGNPGLKTMIKPPGMATYRNSRFAELDVRGERAFFVTYLENRCKLALICESISGSMLTGAKCGLGGSDAEESRQDHRFGICSADCFT